MTRALVLLLALTGCAALQQTPVPTAAPAVHITAPSVEITAPATVVVAKPVMTASTDPVAPDTGPKNATFQSQAYNGTITIRPGLTQAQCDAAVALALPKTDFVRTDGVAPEPDPGTIRTASCHLDKAKAAPKRAGPKPKP